MSSSSLTLFYSAGTGRTGKLRHIDNIDIFGIKAEKLHHKAESTATLSFIQATAMSSLAMKNIFEKAFAAAIDSRAKL